MTYRDDNEALRARVDELEASLARERADTARLRGDAVRPGAARSAGLGTILGVPTRFDREELLPFEISERGYERIAALLRERMSVQVSQVGHTLHAPSFSLAREEGGTRIRLTGDWSTQWIGVVAGAAMSFLFPGVPLIAFFAVSAADGMPLVALHGIWAIPTIVLGSGWGMRKLLARQVTEARTKHAGVFEAVVDVARVHAIAPPPGTRVEIAGDEEALDDEPEARRALR